MEINRDALTQVVKATRMSMRMAETMQKLLPEKNCVTVADEIVGMLQDALFYLCGDENKGSFEDTKTVKLLKGELSDNAVADTLMMFSKVNARIAGTKNAETVQPKPNTIEPQDWMKIWEENGGYMTPEGEWK